MKGPMIDDSYICQPVESSCHIRYCPGAFCSPIMVFVSGKVVNE